MADSDKYTARTTDTQAVESFKQWFSAQGHWVYEYRADAVRTWRERGVIGRPRHTAEREALLSGWVAADPLPALVAKLSTQAAT